MLEEYMFVPITSPEVYHLLAVIREQYQASQAIKVRFNRLTYEAAQAIGDCLWLRRPISLNISVRNCSPEIGRMLLKSLSRCSSIGNLQIKLPGFQVHSEAFGSNWKDVISAYQATMEWKNESPALLEPQTNEQHYNEQSVVEPISCDQTESSSAPPPLLNSCRVLKRSTAPFIDQIKREPPKSKYNHLKLD